MGAFGWLHFSPQSRQAGMPRPVGSGTNHAAVNLLPGHGACMNTKEHGTRTPATDTSVGCSSFSRRGELSAAWDYLTGQHPVNSSTGRISPIDVTATRGGSGPTPPERVDYSEEDS